MGVPEVLGDACHTYTNALGKSAVGLEHDAGSKQENVVPWSGPCVYPSDSSWFDCVPSMDLEFK